MIYFLHFLAPSASPRNLQVTHFTHNVIDVAWSSPDHSEINGVLTQYSVCIRKQSSDSCLHEVTVPPTKTSYRFSGLKPYVMYNIEIKAATLAGYGPLANTSQTTEQTGMIYSNYKQYTLHFKRID